jgi:RNA polymerase sigma-70 factor (ECF subfamily)
MSTGAARKLDPTRDLADEELVQDVLSGQASRFDLLVRRHERRLRSAVRGVLRDRSEVDDVVQQAFEHAFAGLGRFAGTATFATWLTRIAINEALLEARRSRLVRRARLELAPRADGFPGTPEQEACWREAAGRVRIALVRLPDHHREVLQLVLDGLSRAEIAGRLGIRAGAAKVRVHRARVALRALVVGGRPGTRVGTPRLAVASRRGGLISSSRPEVLPTG